MRSKTAIIHYGMWPCSLIILRRRQEAGCRETQYPFILADDHARTAISAYGGINSKLGSYA